MRTVGLREFRNLNTNLGIKRFIGHYANPDNTFVMFEPGEEGLYQALLDAIKESGRGTINKLPAHELLKDVEVPSLPNSDPDFVEEDPDHQTHRLPDDIEFEEKIPLQEQEERVSLSEGWVEWKTEALEKLGKKTTNLASMRKILKEMIERI